MSQVRILIVEDEPIVAVDVQRRLQLLGYPAPQTLASGEEAVNFVEEIEPDLILMDIMLEGEIDGIEAATLIRERKPVPIIYLTAYADEDILDRAKITEPFGYILKPFEDRELQTCIEMALYKRDMEFRLQESERWHAATLRNIGDAVISTDVQGVIRLFNPMAEILTGLGASEALGRPFQEAVRPARGNNAEQLQNLLGFCLHEETMRLGKALELEDQDGNMRTVDVTISRIDNHDIPTPEKSPGSGMVFVLHDITEQHKAKEVLHQSVNSLRRTLDETVAALTMTTEKRDPYTSGHQQRVAKLASAVAVKMGLQDDRTKGVHVAGLLHDIGKIYVPAEILSKPARLSDMEMSIMRTHSEVGYDILKHISFPWPVAQMVLQHHERIDGSGYPGGLKDRDILLESKILMVADVVEAMSSHRPYRAALGLDLALEEVVSKKGRWYDVDVVEACLLLFNDDGFTFDP